MGVESATFITDFVAANPGSSDLVSEGDNHLRLVKQVLQNSFPTASKAWYNPNFATKTADFTVAATDMNKIFFVDTTAGIVNMTMPTLAAGDAGWECTFIKYNFGPHPVLVKPPSGTIFTSTGSLAAARRAIPCVRIRVYWSSSAWFVDRAITLPIGSLIAFAGSTLPPGFEWPSGQTLASASTNYPEYNSAIGSGLTPDIRGRYIVTKDDLGGSAAGRTTTAGGGVDGATLSAVGGVQNFTLITANLPPYTPAGSVSVNSTVTDVARGSGISANVPGGASSILSWTASQTISSTGSLAGTAQGGTSTAVKTLPPSIVMNRILVVE